MLHKICVTPRYIGRFDDRCTYIVYADCMSCNSISHGNRLPFIWYFWNFGKSIQAYKRFSHGFDDNELVCEPKTLCASLFHLKIFHIRLDNVSRIMMHRMRAPVAVVSYVRFSQSHIEQTNQTPTCRSAEILSHQKGCR